MWRSAILWFNDNILERGSRMALKPLMPNAHRRIAGFLLLVLAGVAPAGAADFDCSVVYDEFDQLMMANFLIEPSVYVETLSGSLTRSEYILFQVEQFKLREQRGLPGIGIVRTNHNLRGKMLFNWHDVGSEELVRFTIEELILFGRIADGDAPVRMGSIVTLPGFAVDLDSGAIVESDDESADLLYEHSGSDFVIRAIEPAELMFPIQSLCAPASLHTDTSDANGAEPMPSPSSPAPANFVVRQSDSGSVSSTD